MSEEEDGGKFDPFVSNPFEGIDKEIFFSIQMPVIYLKSNFFVYRTRSNQ